MAAGTITELTSAIEAGVTSIELQRYNTGTISNLTEADFTNTSIIRLSGHYLV